MPSLKPNRLRGVGPVVSVEDALPKPSCAQRTAARPAASRVRLRTACTATCGSSEQAWIERSPPQRAGSSVSPGNCGRSARASGRCAARPKRSSNSARPEAHGQREVRGVQPDGLAGVGRGSEAALGAVAADPPVRRSCRARPVVQSWSSADERIAVGRRDVVRGEVQVPLDRRGDPGLVRAVELDQASPAARRCPLGRRSRRHADDPGRPECAGPREEVPAADAAAGRSHRRGGQPREGLAEPVDDARPARGAAPRSTVS